MGYVNAVIGEQRQILAEPALRAREHEPLNPIVGSGFAELETPGSAEDRHAVGVEPAGDGVGIVVGSDRVDPLRVSIACARSGVDDYRVGRREPVFGEQFLEPRLGSGFDQGYQVPPGFEVAAQGVDCLRLEEPPGPEHDDGLGFLGYFAHRCRDDTANPIAPGAERLEPARAAKLLAGIIGFSSDIEYVLLFLENVKQSDSPAGAPAALSQGLQLIEFDTVSSAQMRRVLQLMVELFDEKERPAAV